MITETSLVDYDYSKSKNSQGNSKLSQGGKNERQMSKMQKMKMQVKNEFKPTTVDLNFECEGRNQPNFENNTNATSVVKVLNDKKT